ncbi:UDP-glucose--hexose-1-phosphate uridylyltransferase [Porphyrobacter sp. AAP82]|uniref:UDP-glucose--hexose-1-phosphate uridylyltransferase n=1 Tax=Porphyrobacter sp. AAP82 TaxID=1248917 RepID=UPI0002F134FF|nr:UDP-glucose--hexose-1-phosphate uridylyltransferase [Porphyrobacter sp. AAP82]
MNLDPARPHRRFNPLTGGWVQVSPQRMGRPWQGEVTAPDPLPPAYDAGCYLCPGNARVGGEANPDYAGVHVFDNDFPALADSEAGDAGDDPLLRAQASAGVCRVICFSPDHGKSLPLLRDEQLRSVIGTWADQTAELGQRFQHVQVFENKGAMMGCSNPHPHGQIWATAHLPQEIATEDARQRDYLSQHGRPLLLDLAQREAAGERVVESNHEWLAIVPFWAAWPFETLLLPRFAVQRMPDLTGSQRASLAGILKALTTRYDNLFQTSFPYSMGWHGAPFGGEGAQDHWQLHAHFYPPLLRSASVRKFMVGYEMLAEPQRDLTPERAAEMLRSVSGLVHYRA